MALGNDNFSIDGVQNILELGRNSLEQNISYVYGEGNQFDIEIERILDLIQQVKNREKEILALFGCSNPVSFRQKVLEAYNKSGLSAFVGLDLQQNFLNKYKDALQIKESNKEELYRQILNQIVEVVNAEVQNSGESVKDAFHKAIRPTKNAGIVNVSERGATVNLTYKDIFKIDNNNQIIGIYLDEMTPAIEKRINGILNDKQWKQHFPGLKNLNKKLKKGKNNLTITTSSVWFNATQGLKASEIEDMIKKNPAAKVARDKANKEILDELSRYVDSSFKTIFIKEVQNMLKQSPNMFYVGGSLNAITGILGEISALVVLKSLFPTKSFSFQWVAQQTDNGKQLSVDILLKKGLQAYGIQIKNSSQINLDTLEIPMIDLTLDSFFDKEMRKKDDLKHALETSYFNKSYIVDVPVKAGSNPDFDEIEQDLKLFQESVNDFLIRFAPEMLYIQNEDRTEKTFATLTDSLKTMTVSGNLVYFVAGYPYFASEQLDLILKQIENLKLKYEGVNLPPSPFAPFHIKESGTTIIDYLNKRADNRQSIALHDVRVRLSSSMIFHRG